MQILVTGAAGFIGSIITEVLIDQDHQVVAIDNLVQGHREAVHPGANFLLCDLTDPLEIFEVLSQFQIDAVIHLAAESIVSRSIHHPSPVFRTNVLGGINLLEAMRHHGVTDLIFSSSAAVYGAPITDRPREEHDPLLPINPYGESKLMFERILQSYWLAYGLRSTSLRYFNAAGASSTRGENHNPESHLIPLLLDVAQGKLQAIKIFGTDYDTADGTAIRDYVHVLDLAKAHLLALLNLEGFTVYNLGSDQGHSVLEVIQAAREITGHPIPTFSAPRRDGDPPVLIASSRMIRSELDWVPDYPDLHSIIQSAWDLRS